jgi:putative tryptophan/tyrosine transport system substrate-binding protein
MTPWEGHVAIHIQRREFVVTLGGAVVAWPLAARAQQPERMRRIGVLVAAYTQADREGQARIAAFLDTSKSLGWTDGRNVRIEYRWAAGDADRGKYFATELVRSAPDVMVANGNPVLIELHRLTSTIPIVFTQVSDPVGSGIVAGLARPGGNITGFTNFEPEMGGKWVGLLKEAAPNMSRVAVVFGSDARATVALLRAAEAVAPALAVEVTAVDLHDGAEIERAIAGFASQPNGGLIVTPYPSAVANRASIIVLAARHRLPAVYPFRYFATEGGVMSYGPDQIEQWRGAATYVDRILRGEKPGDLPVQAPTRFELVVNMKTAKALGLNIPPAFSLRAEEVIE